MTLNQAGIALQVLAAAYIVLQAWRTAKALERAGTDNVTIDGLEVTIRELGREMRGQFAHQLGGFIVMALGALMQALS